MLDSFKAQLTFPTAAAYTKATTYDAVKRGSSMSSAVYIVDPATIATAGLVGVDEFRHTVAQTRRNPGQSGSERVQVLTQLVCLDINGRPHVWSCNVTVTAPNHFVPPTGVAVNSAANTKAVVACNVGYILNPTDSTTAGTQDDVTEKFIIGVMP